MGVSVGDGVSVGVGVGVAEGVEVGLGVAVLVGVAVGGTVPVLVGEPVGDGVGVFVSIGTGMNGRNSGAPAWIYVLPPMQLAAWIAATLVFVACARLNKVSPVWTM